jgi:non-specific serine/threonine protein kinase
MNVESVALFVERARATQPSFSLTPADAADVVEICRRLDGIPLALELAAARVRLLGVAQIRARLGDRFKLLARPGGGVSRQQTVLATIQWSWDHLLPPEQDLMRRLAVFTGGWTLERATAVVSDSGDEFEVLDLLTRLVERSLVVVERPAATAARYRFLESVHQFALERLQAHADHELMRERHLAAYLELAESAAPKLRSSDIAEQIAELKPEEENLLAALAWCERAPDGARRGLQFVEHISRFWSVLGRYALGRRVIAEALQRDAANRPSAERARALTRAAGLAITVGDHEAARSHLEEALAFWRSSDDPRGLPATLAGLGVVAMYQSRFEDALSLGQESLAIYEQRGERRGVAMALHNIATLECTLARPHHGRSRFERALTLLREVGDPNTEALCLSGLATARLRCGDREAACRAMRECLELLAGLASPREGVYALDALAELLFAEHRNSEAARLVGAAEAARIALGLTHMTAERAEMDKLNANLRATMGADAFEQAMAVGRTLSLTEALAEGRRILESL